MLTGRPQSATNGLVPTGASSILFLPTWRLTRPPFSFCHQVRRPKGAPVNTGVLPPLRLFGVSEAAIGPPPSHHF